MLSSCFLLSCFSKSNSFIVNTPQSIKVIMNGEDAVIDVKSTLIVSRHSSFYINKVFQKLFSFCLLSYQYCLDYDLDHFRRYLLNQFHDDFKYPGILPGGSLCMLHHTETIIRPQNSGPYGFITPAGTYSRPHRDGGVSGRWSCSLPI